jgi:hypothetical protein
VVGVCPGHCFEHCICPSGQLDVHGTPIDASAQATEKSDLCPDHAGHVVQDLGRQLFGMGALVHRLEGRITARVAAAADRSLAEHRPVAVTESSRTESASPPAEFAWIGLTRLPTRAKGPVQRWETALFVEADAVRSRAREAEWYSFGNEPRLPAFDQLRADHWPRTDSSMTSCSSLPALS